MDYQQWEIDMKVNESILYDLIRLAIKYGDNVYSTYYRINKTYGSPLTSDLTKAIFFCDSDPMVKNIGEYLLTRLMSWGDGTGVTDSQRKAREDIMTMFNSYNKAEAKL